jgi:2-haloacid dehalogenase
VDAVFFDLFGTLLSLGPLDDGCEALAPGAGSELAARWRARQLELSWLRTVMDRWVDFDQVTEEALGSVVAEMGVQPGTAAIERVAGAFRELAVHPEVPGVLERLRDGGVVTGILTNASRTTLDLIIDRTGLRMDHALSVDAVRRFKPSPAVYALATEATGLPPERIGFVTGNAWDAAGAGAFGFRVAWLRAPGGAALPAVGAPQPVAATLASVPRCSSARRVTGRCQRFAHAKRCLSLPRFVSGRNRADVALWPPVVEIAQLRPDLAAPDLDQGPRVARLRPLVSR